MNKHLDNETIALLRQKKKKRIRYLIIACLFIFLFLNFLENKVFQLGEVPFPVSGNVLVFVVININIILLLLMVFLVLRNLVELVFDRKRKIIGTKLRTKLVISFVSLSLIPTTLLFFIAMQFVSTSMDYWFNINVDRSLQQSLALAQEVYKDSTLTVVKRGQQIQEELRESNLFDIAKVDSSFWQKQRKIFDLNEISLFTVERSKLMSLYDESIDPIEIPEVPVELWRRCVDGDDGVTMSVGITPGELVRSLTLLSSDKNTSFVLISSILIPRERLERLNVISKGIEGYRQLLFLKKPIKTSLLVMLLIVTLLIIFSAVWFGFYVAGGLTKPMDKLSEGIKKVADGDLDFVLEKDSEDEMGMLVDSFNSMTCDLLMGKIQVDEANKALLVANVETERRRRYTEIILQNVTAGVIALDALGRVITINKFAEELLGIKRSEIINKNYKTILRMTHLTLLEGFFGELNSSAKTTIQRPLKVTVGNANLSLLVNFTKLADDEGKSIGVVIVFDNLTELEKIQRMAAWREVARRIAHEVKNPLTPIQLSAQRLRKRYLERLDGEAEVFDQCTRTIINQVDALKHLVSEFSSFARMPAVNKSLNDVTAMAEDVLILYKEAHKYIDFNLTSEKPQAFFFDLDQIKRVVVNLLDNAVAALDKKGAISIEIYARETEKLIFIEVSDNGPGIKESDKTKLFEPYFSTKKTGTGLGLAIASTVVSDHSGYIRIKDNVPQGARFIIELPMVLES